MKTKRDIEAVDFIVYFQDNREPMKFVSTDESKYIWGVGMAGELFVTNTIENTQFSVVVKENRIRVWNHRVWDNVAVLYNDK